MPGEGIRILSSCLASFINSRLNERFREKIKEPFLNSARWENCASLRRENQLQEQKCDIFHMTIDHIGCFNRQRYVHISDQLKSNLHEGSAVFWQLSSDVYFDSLSLSVYLYLEKNACKHYSCLVIGGTGLCKCEQNH